MRFDEIETLICQVTHSYKNKVRWADIATLKQIAWETFLESLKNYDSAKGARKAYFKAVISRQIRNAISKEGSPVSASNSKKLRGHTIEDIENISDSYPDLRLNPLEVLLKKECGLHVSSQLVQVVKNQSIYADIVLKILFAEVTPREIARKENIDLKKLYKEVHRARKALRENKQLQRMAKDFL